MPTSDRLPPSDVILREAKNLPLGKSSAFEILPHLRLPRMTRGWTFGRPAKANTSAELVDGIREKVASTLDLSPKCVSVDHWRFSNFRDDFPVTLHCQGNSAGRRFFAKIFVADPYPVAPRVTIPNEHEPPRSQQLRPLEEQIELEWNTTNQLRALAGPGYIPTPLRRSQVTRTIVWEEVRGKRLQDFFARLRWTDSEVDAGAAALFQAGGWLRRVHDASFRGNEMVDIAGMIETIRNLVRREGLCSSKYARIACGLLQAALVSVGGGKFPVPVALSHGDFALPNLIWDNEVGHLSIVDYEHVGQRIICHDLLCMVFNLRRGLLNPFIPRAAILAWEKSFWAGYGPTPMEIAVFVSALASSRIFYYHLPRVSRLWRRRGWLRGLQVLLFKSLLEGFVVRERLGVPGSLWRPAENQKECAFNIHAI